MSTVIESLERSQLRRVPAFDAGDRLRVHFQVIEGTRRRTQVFEGVVVEPRATAPETFTVRKQSFGVGVERTFPLHSPKIERIEVAARGDVRRAKLCSCAAGSASAPACASAGPPDPRWPSSAGSLLLGPDGDGEPTPVDAEGATAEETVAEAVEAQEAAAETAETAADNVAAESEAAEPEAGAEGTDAPEPAASADATDAGEEEPATDDE